MKRYLYLSQKLQNKTITKTEKGELFILAFGEDYMKSKNKGTLKEYAE
jgi:hypothetical protein